MHIIIDVNNRTKAINSLKEIFVSTGGVEIMADKMQVLNIKLRNVSLGAANILKQEMLSLGAEAAVARGVVNGKSLVSDVILIGSIDKYKKLIRKLEHQEIFGLKDIRSYLSQLILIESDDQPRLMQIKDTKIDLTKLNVMGILNITPDSFSDGAYYLEPDKALDHAVQMNEEGAVIIDIGAESTKPGTEPIDEDEELKRLLPVIKKIKAKTNIICSLDTYHAKTAEICINEGIDIVNDISALRSDPEMIKVMKKFTQVPIVLMHMQGTPKTMQVEPFYHHVIDEIVDFFEERISYCTQNEIEIQRLIIDPGICFGKRLEDNFCILDQLISFKTFNLPVLLGSSRKSFIGQIYPSSVSERLSGTLATTAQAHHSKISFVRVHDVKANVDLIKVLDRIKEQK